MPFRIYAVTSFLTGSPEEQHPEIEGYACPTVSKAVDPLVLLSMR